MAPKPKTVDDLDRDVDAAFDRIKKIEKAQDDARHREDNIAKLTVQNARDIQEIKGKGQIVAFITGALKDTMKAKFKEFRDKKIAQREKKDGAQGVVAMQDAGQETWPSVFMTEVVQWMRDAVGDGGSHAELRDSCSPSIEQLGTILANQAYKSVIMNPRDCPDGKPWVATISIHGGTTGG